jgi:hypothetical protein
MHACARSGWDYITMIEKVRNATLSAVIADNTILEPASHSDPTCSLHILDTEIEPYDLALGFKRTFNNSAFLRAVNEVLLLLLENGTLEVRTRQASASINTLTFGYCCRIVHPRHEKQQPCCLLTTHHTRYGVCV